MRDVSHAPGTWIDPSSGQEIGKEILMDRMALKRVVLPGETHDRYDIHLWQLDVLQAMHSRKQKVVAGFEMFPRRVQPVLDAWVAGEYDTDEFLEKVEWKTVWGFPADLYLPIFQFCRQSGITMKALNCRRALVSEVGKSGWDAIAEADRDGVTPAKPATAACRQYLFDITGGGRPDRKASSAMDPEFDRFVRAQQTWDRAFACNIANVLETAPDALVVGIIGSGHLAYGHGTPFQLADLGISDVAVLLHSDAPTLTVSEPPFIADAVFRGTAQNEATS